MAKKIPLRQCMGCREMKPKKELVRVVRGTDGNVSIDLKGKAPGRGAYVCRDTECLKKALRSKAIDRSLSVTVPPELIDRLTAELEAAGGTE